MDTNLASAALWSYGLALAAHLGLVFLAWRSRQGFPHPITGIFFLLAGLATSFWAGGILWQETHPAADFFKGIQALDSLRYGAWYGFMVTLLYYRPGTRLTENVPLTLSLVAAAVVACNVVLQAVLEADFAVEQPLLRLSHYAALGQVVFAGVILEQLVRNTTIDSRWNIKPLAIALAAIFAYDLYFHSQVLLFGRADDDTYVVRGLAHSLVLPLILLTLYRTRARKLKVSLSRTATFQTTSLAISGLYLLVASAAGYYVRYAGGSWGGALQLAVLFAALVVLLLLALSGTMRAYLRILIGKHFLRYRYDYREEWLKFTQALTTTDDSLQIGQLVIRGLADMVESPGGALWMLDPTSQRFSQRARWNQPESAVTESMEGSLAGFLENRNWIINLEEYRHMPGRYEGLALPEWLVELPNAWLVIPLSTARGMIGFVVLSTARVAIDANWEVNDLLRTAGRQAAAFLAMIQASEALLESRKFESFNRMSAFVVHDLKNIVTQLSLMVRNAERHAGNAEFQQDMLLTVQHSVERMKQLMLQLREGTPATAGSHPIELGTIARRVQQSKRLQLPEVELTIQQKVSARGHEDRIERVLGHLVQNALDATDESGRVWINVGKEDNMALVEVGDTGHGMSAEFIRDQLFRPFKTTKQAGMGIGAFESQQYIKELGGDIQVSSSAETGTLFRIKLPILETGLNEAALVQ